MKKGEGMGGRHHSWGMGYVWGLLKNHGVTRSGAERKRGGGGGGAVAQIFS